MLNGALVLVAEDQALIALDIAFAVEDAGGKVAGPVASVKTALALIKTQSIGAAILDFNLTDGNATPVLTALVASNIPTVIQSGVGLSPELVAKFPNLVVFIKPSDTAQMIHTLCRLIAALEEQAPNSSVK